MASLDGPVYAGKRQHGRKGIALAKAPPKLEKEKQQRLMRRHPNNHIRRPPPTRTDRPADTRQFDYTFMFDEPCSGPHMSPSPATIAARCQSELQRRATQND